MPDKAQTTGDPCDKATMGSEFHKALDSLVEHFTQRLNDIRSRLTKSASVSPSRRDRFERTWGPKLQAFDDALAQFRRFRETRPSLCLMGKRGQGKTSLVEGWLGCLDGQQGLKELRLLPTGVNDTTACLTRLTLNHEEETDKGGFLSVDLFGKGDVLVELQDHRAHAATPSPPYPDLPESFAFRTTPGHEDDFFLICRFPQGESDLAQQLNLAKTNENYALTASPGIRLASAQWFAREVTIPIHDGVDLADHIHRLIDTVDIVDAPGADAMYSGMYPEFRRNKNARVFQIAVDRLDTMLLVASLQPAAAQLGAQFQEDVWKPWLDRCEGNGAGRLIIVLTHTADAFAMAKDQVTPNDDAANLKPNNDTNFANLVLKNVLEGVMGAISGTKSFINQSDPSSWPPIFFTERRYANLQCYSEGIEPHGAKVVAEMLCGHLDAKEIPANLPLGQRCVLHMARDWFGIYGLAADVLRPVQEWLIHALCALLDPKDRGYSRLTEFVIRYATYGPVAENHCRERKERAEDIGRQFMSLLGDFRQPAGNAEALAKLQQARELYCQLWKEYPAGPVLYLADACQRRREAATENGKPGTKRLPFTFEDVLSDVVADISLQLTFQKRTSHANLPNSEIKSAGEILRQLLQHDEPLKNLKKKYWAAVQSNRQVLQRVQAVTIERAVRVMSFLATAQEERLAEVARHCFEADIEEVDLVRPLLESDVTQMQVADEAVVKRVQEREESLRKAIQQSPCPAPYVVRSGNTSEVQHA